MRDGAIGVADGRLVFVGAHAALTDAPEQLAQQVRSLNGAWVTPGLIDCHTHTLYAGDGVLDFEMRLTGAIRQELYSSGGGVPGVVQRVRAASDQELFAATVRRVSALLASGVTVLEIKSGFGLDAIEYGPEVSALRNDLITILARQAFRDFLHPFFETRQSHIRLLYEPINIVSP